MNSSKFDQSKEYFIAYSMLVNAARQRGFATYLEIAKATGIPTVGNQFSRKMGQLLGTISGNEKKQGRPMLSAIAVGVKGEPGQGFYTWAKELGFMSTGEDEQTFWKSECEKVYDEWKIG